MQTKNELMATRARVGNVEGLMLCLEEELTEFTRG